jgi:hypothetical protein
MGLKALKAKLAREEDDRKNRSESGGFEKALRDYDLMKKHGGKFRMRFVQEFDEDAANANPELGFGVFYTEHNTPYNPNNPKGFRSARCTMEKEGKCYGCERYADRSDELSSKWRAFDRGYVNAIAETTDEDGKTVYLPFVWSQKARAAVVAQLMDYAEEADTITDSVFSFSKSGTGTDTKYNLMPTRVDVTPYSAEGVKLYDLTKVSPDIAYEKQAAFYGGTPVVTEEAVSSTSSAKVASDEDW